MALKNTWADGDLFAAADENAVATQVNTNTTNIPALNGAGLWSARPAAGNVGRVYFATDNGNVYRDNGTTWDLVRQGGSGVGGGEPPTTGWVTTTLGSTTFVADKGGRVMTTPPGSGINIRAEFQPLSPAINYTATVCLDYTQIRSTQWESGIWLRNSTSGSIIQFGMTTASGGGLTLQAFKFTNQTTLNSGYGTPIATSAFGILGGSVVDCVRIRDDGTSRNFEYSLNGGVTWLLYFSVGRTDFITPDQVGWGLDPQGSGVTQILRLRSFAITSP